MTDYGDYKDEMADNRVTDELLDLLAASGRNEGSPSPVAEFLQQLESLGDFQPEDSVRTRHLAMLTGEAALIPVVDPVANVSTGPLVRRRRLAIRSLVSGLVLNAPRRSANSGTSVGAVELGGGLVQD